MDSIKQPSILTRIDSINNFIERLIEILNPVIVERGKNLSTECPELEESLVMLRLKGVEDRLQRLINSIDIN